MRGFQCCRLLELEVSGFKSLRRVKLGMPSRLTILVGPNGSGKTAIIESLLLLRDTLDYLRGHTVNPFLRWWGYHHVVWRHDETKPIELKVVLGCGECREEDLKKYRLEAAAKEALELVRKRRISYVARITGVGGDFRILSDEACLEGIGCLAVRQGKLLLRVAKSPNVDLRSMLNLFSERVLLDMLRENMPSEIIDAMWDCLAELARNPARMEEASEGASTALGEEARKLLLELLEKTSGTTLGAEGEGGISSILEVYTSSIKGERLTTLFSKDVRRFAQDIAERVGKGLQRILHEMLQTYCSRGAARKDERAASTYDIIARFLAHLMVYGIAQGLVTYILDLLAVAAYMVGLFIDNIVVLRPLDYRSLRSPQPLEAPGRLREDGSNLLSVLFSLGGGRLPEDVAEVLASVLRASSVSGFFEPTADGRVAFRLVVDGVEVSQPSIPEGAWKTMAIMAAVLVGASLVAVDEFENSLHASAQELLLEELRENVPTSIVATHSPVVVDAARSLDEIVLVELRAGETVARRVGKPEELAERLRRLGITPSEALLYGLLEA
jgi:predicted ATPase